MSNFYERILNLNFSFFSLFLFGFLLINVIEYEKAEGRERERAEECVWTTRDRKNKYEKVFNAMINNEEESFLLSTYIHTYT